MTNFESEIEKNGYIVFTNKGDSMMPLLRQDKDLLVIRKITEPLKKYDAVLFKRPNGAYVLHRIIKVLGDGKYLIAGDNRCFSEVIEEELIIGILTEIIKDKKHISVDSKEYKKYLKRLPLRRFALKISSYIRAAIRKLKRISGRKKQ